MKPYTVLLLRPDYQWDGAPHQWTFQSHITALTPKDAAEAARADLEVSEMLDESSVAVLAVYEGHLKDLYPGG